MIAQSLADAIRADLEKGRSHRQIAMNRGVGVNTVARIAKGGWGASGYTPSEKSAMAFPTNIEESAKRCDGCGHRVYIWPCLTCHIKARK